MAGALWPAAAERATSEETGDAKYWALSGGDCPQLIQEVCSLSLSQMQRNVIYAISAPWCTRGWQVPAVAAAAAVD